MSNGRDSRLLWIFYQPEYPSSRFGSGRAAHEMGEYGGQVSAGYRAVSAGQRAFLQGDPLLFSVAGEDSGGFVTGQARGRIGNAVLISGQQAVGVRPGNRLGEPAAAGRFRLGSALQLIEDVCQHTPGNGCLRHELLRCNTPHQPRLIHGQKVAVVGGVCRHIIEREGSGRDRGCVLPGQELGVAHRVQRINNSLGRLEVFRVPALLCHGQDLLRIHLYAEDENGNAFAERYHSCMVKPNGLGGAGGGTLTMPIDVTFGGTREVGTASVADDGTITFTPAASGGGETA